MDTPELPNSPQTEALPDKHPVQMAMEELQKFADRNGSWGEHLVMTQLH